MDNNLTEIYNLNKSKKNYKNLKNDLKQIINKLSSDDIGVTLNRAASSLNNNYIINGSQPRSKEINEVRESIYGYISDINRVISSLENKISSIDREVDELSNADD